MKRSVFFLFMALCALSQLGRAQSPSQDETDASPKPGQVDGYLADTREERDTKYYEVLMVPPAVHKSPPISDLIFNSQLSAEFRKKYRDQFGQLDTTSIVYQPSLFQAFDSNGVPDQQQVADEQVRAKFGNYMVRRITEWHVDNFVKTDPSVRPLYEAKEKLSNLDVKIDKQTKFQLRYNLSDNTADLILDNAYLDMAKVQIQMNRSSFGPSSPQEEKLMLQKQVTTTVRANTTVYNTDGTASEEFVEKLKYNWTTSLIVTAAYKAGGTSTRDTKYGWNIQKSF